MIRTIDCYVAVCGIILVKIWKKNRVVLLFWSIFATFFWTFFAQFLGILTGISLNSFGTFGGHFFGQFGTSFAAVFNFVNSKKMRSLKTCPKNLLQKINPKKLTPKKYPKKCPKKYKQKIPQKIAKKMFQTKSWSFFFLTWIVAPHNDSIEWNLLILQHIRHSWKTSKAFWLLINALERHLRRQYTLTMTIQIDIFFFFVIEN